MAWFNFLGKNSNDFDIVVEKYPQFYIPIKSFDKVTIAGNDKAEYRQGTYEPIILSFECYIKDRTPSKTREVSRWLNSNTEGKLIRGDDEEVYYNARVINAIPISKVAKSFGRFIIQFECEPFAYKLNDEVITITSNTEIENLGIAEAKPIYKVYGSNATLKVNNKEFKILSISEYIEIDTDLMECYKDDVSMNTNVNGSYVDLWLKEGINTIEITGASKVEIMPNWRY